VPSAVAKSGAHLPRHRSCDPGNAQLRLTESAIFCAKSISKALPIYAPLNEFGE
jgi:hypothetical protein